MKAIIKHFEAPQRSVKIKISVNFYLNSTFWNARGGKGANFCDNFMISPQLFFNTYDINFAIALRLILYKL